MKWGHLFSTTLFNQRNMASLTLAPDRRVSFGGNGYSEVDLLAEGISDWFAHNQTGRTQVFPWAGGISQSNRPVTESDVLHQHNNFGLAPDAENRLHYPDFINYYHYDPLDYQAEDVQQAGMIISHFLVALGEKIAATCEVNSARSKELVFYLLQETLNELGDLSTTGSDANAPGTINMTPQSSDTWVHLYTAPNPRLFAQKLAKHFRRVIDGKAACNGIVFGQDILEELIDSYGLLLFRTYNENASCHRDTTPANAIPDCREGDNTAVITANRRKSILLPKTVLQLDQREGSSLDGVWVFDHQRQIKERLNALKATGQVLAQDLGRIDAVAPDNNNNNNRISPGEVIGIALNLYNDSDLPMGGVQTLANNWDHVKEQNSEVKMCNTFADGFPALAQGGAGSDTLPLSEGDCGYITRENGQKITERQEIIAPICFILYHDTTETRWISQREYMAKIGGNVADCLLREEPLACYFRAIPGADQAWYSKLDPRSNWVDTYAKSTHFSENEAELQFEGKQYHAF